MQTRVAMSFILALAACGEPTQPPAHAATPSSAAASATTASQESLAALEEPAQELRECSTSCSGKRPDGSSWQNSCGTSGCSTCITAQCSENECVAGCASVAGQPVPAASVAEAPKPRAPRDLEKKNDTAGANTTTCSCPQIASGRIIPGCTATCTSPSYASCNCNYWSGVGTWNVNSCFCRN